MPNREMHVKIGLGVAVAVVVLVVILADEDRRIRLTELIGTGAGVLTGAVLPDKIEPADTPNHRDTAHSLVALYGSGHVSVAPPEPLMALQKNLRDRADQIQDKRLELPDDHEDQLPLWLGRCACDFAAGFSKGLPYGYASHLMADMGTSPLPPV